MMGQRWFDLPPVGKPSPRFRSGDEAAAAPLAPSVSASPGHPNRGRLTQLLGAVAGSDWGQAALARNGGAGGIRTLEGVAPLRHFQCRALGQLGDRSPGGF